MADGLDDGYEPPICGFRVSGFRTLQDVEIRCRGQVTVIWGPGPDPVIFPM